MYMINPKLVEHHISERQREAENDRLARIARGDRQPAFTRMMLGRLLNRWRSRPQGQPVESDSQVYRPRTMQRHV